MSEVYKFEVFKKSKYWRIKAANGRILAHSEVYHSGKNAEQACLKFINTICGAEIKYVVKYNG